MRVLWLCNSVLEVISETLGTGAPVNGGWLNGYANELLAHTDIKLVICYPQEETGSLQMAEGPKWSSVGFPRSWEFSNNDKLSKLFEKTLREVMPDVIHLHGTEFPHCELMMKSAIALGLKARVVASIQGLVSVCAEHLFDGIPRESWNIRTLSDAKNRLGLLRMKADYERRGVSEQHVISITPNIIGRTLWDEACCREINKDIRYFHCGEILRNQFYTAKAWCPNDSHAIFFSQGDKPIKSLHMLIHALGIIRRRYPDVKVIVSGSQGIRDDIVRGTGYGVYCGRLAKSLGVLDCFSFLGTVGPQSLIGAMLSCSCFVSSSAMENSSNAFGEAMMLGLPCVSSYVGGMPSMATDGSEALFYPYLEPNMLASHVIRLFGNPDYAKRIGEAGRKRAQINHSKERVRNDLVRIYELVSAC